MDQKALGRKIEKLRTEKRLTQEELADKTNISVRTIQRIEKGEVKPRSFTLKILSEALGYNLLSIDSSEKISIWTVIIHLSNFFPIVVIPLVIWLLKRDESEMIRKQGAKVINYQILVLIINIAYLIYVQNGATTLSVSEINSFVRISTAFNIAYWGLNLLFTITNLIWAASGRKIIYPGLRIVK